MDKTLDAGRRHALRLLGGITLAGLGGCCSLRPFPSNKIGGDPPAADSIIPFLRPRLTASPSKPTKYCLDVHAHFFNASDVNVKGYVEESIAHGNSSPALREFVKLLAPLVDDLAGLAPQAKDEFDFVSRQMAATEFQSFEEGAHVLDALADQHRRMVAKEIFSEMKKRGLDSRFIELLQRHRSQTMHTEALLTPIDFTEDTVLDAIDPAKRLERHLNLFGTFEPPADAAEAGGALEFAGHMLSYRWMNLRTYQQFYTEAEDAFGIDGVFSALVDFDYWLDCPARSSREDQVKLHSLLSMLSGGYMLPLVSYNPWTDIKRNGESLRLVQKAIMEYGFIGVKIYPPMGYYPFGNEKLHNSSNLPRPNLHDLDDRLEALFSWCAAQGVPVMAHTGESMGRDDPSDEFGGPDGWAALFKRFDGAMPPIVQAGHYGGDKQKEGNTRNWSAEFAVLADSSGGAGFYGDLGYWDSLLWCDQEHPECTTAKERLKAALKAGKHTEDRIMYGTDWFMISVLADWGHYPQRLVKNLEGILPLDKLFYTNAINCYGLGKGGVQRNRIVKHLEKVKGGLPTWLRDA